jgi:MerR family transcriptional regulator, thiopeptide resistance regulator
VKTETITAFAKRFNLSRSTLLYYDRIGLLKPGGKSDTGYRLYNEADAERMQRIDTFRKAGLSLKAIKEIMATNADDSVEVALEHRLACLNEEMADLKAQQHLVVQLLQRRGRNPRQHGVDVFQWVKMLEEAGMDEQARRRWHMSFERDAPEAHDQFLKSLGLSDTEVAEIRGLSSGDWAGDEPE